MPQSLFWSYVPQLLLSRIGNPKKSVNFWDENMSIYRSWNKWKYSSSTEENAVTSSTWTSSSRTTAQMGNGAPSSIYSFAAFVHDHAWSTTSCGDEINVRALAIARSSLPRRSPRSGPHRMRAPQDRRSRLGAWRDPRDLFRPAPGRMSASAGAQHSRPGLASYKNKYKYRSYRLENVGLENGFKFWRRRNARTEHAAFTDCAKVCMQ